MTTSTLERPTTHTVPPRTRSAAPGRATARSPRRSSLVELVRLSIPAARAVRAANARESVAIASRFADSIRT